MNENNNKHLLDAYYVPVTGMSATRCYTRVTSFKPPDYMRLVLLLWPFGTLGHQGL